MVQGTKGGQPLSFEQERKDRTKQRTTLVKPKIRYKMCMYVGFHVSVPTGLNLQPAPTQLKGGTLTSTGAPAIEPRLIRTSLPGAACSACFAFCQSCGRLCSILDQVDDAVRSAKSLAS